MDTVTVPPYNGPYTFDPDRSAILDKDGWVIASVPRMDGEQGVATGHTLAASWEAVRACKMTLKWVNSLIARFGEEAVLDCLPNNTGGRKWLQAVTDKADGK